MELKTYLAIFWRRKWIIALTTAITLIIALVATLVMTPIYTASTTLRIATTAGADRVRYDDITYADRLMNTYTKIATSGPMLAELAQRLDRAKPPAIKIEIPANTELMQISAEDPDPALAEKAANTLAEMLIAQAKDLYSGGGKSAQEILSEQIAHADEELAQAREEYEDLVSESPDDSDRLAALRRSIELKEETYAGLLDQYEQTRLNEAIRANTFSIIEPAVFPQAPSRPRKALNLGLGLLVGLVGGVGLAFLFENLDTKLYTTGQIQEVAQSPILGKIPVARKPGRIVFNGNSPQEEAFRRLRTNLFAQRHNQPPRTLLITSAEPNEGKSTVVSNLAAMIAQTGRRVIVVDGDLRLPTLHTVFGLGNGLGLSSILTQTATLEEAVQDSGLSGLRVLTSGPLPSNPAELLGSKEMSDLIGRLTERFDMILMDTPSLLAVSDAAAIAPLVDGFVLVVNRAQSRQETVRAAYQQLATINKLIGIVVNRAERDEDYNYYHSLAAQNKK